MRFAARSYFYPPSMPRILFVAAHRPGRSPSQRYRFEQFEPYWREHGWSADHAWLIDAEDDPWFYAPGNLGRKTLIFAKSVHRRWMHTRQAPAHDIVFVQREAFMTGSTFFERAFKRTGVPLIYDFDDAIWQMDVSDGNRRLRWLKNPGKTADLIAMADAVIAGNDYLADYAVHHNPRVQVIPTTIDTDAYPVVPVRRDGPVRIVWTGSPTTIRHLVTALPVLRRLKHRYGDRLRFTVIGDPSFHDADLGVRGQAWDPHTEAADLAVGDIGIMPLPDEEWSKGKCALKGLQYMALGLPVVLSAVGANNGVVQDGINGFTALSVEEWTNKLARLIEDADLRDRIGREARRTVEQRYSVRAWRDAYLDLFNGTIKRNEHGDRSTHRTEAHRAHRHA